MPVAAKRRGLDAASRVRVNDFYARALRRFGPQAPMAVWWASQDTQRRRFEVLAEVGAWDGMRAADVGCGVGDLFGFLQERGLDVSYQGYDISPDMVAAARAKYPQGRARFELRDVVATGLPRRFDYVVASGTFNIRFNHHERYLRRALRTMYEGCSRAVAFNVLTPIPPEHPDAELIEKLYGDLFHHVELEALLAFCRTLTPRIETRQGYLDWDATVFLFR